VVVFTVFWVWLGPWRNVDRLGTCPTMAAGSPPTSEYGRSSEWMYSMFLSERGVSRRAPDLPGRLRHGSDCCGNCVTGPDWCGTLPYSCGMCPTGAEPYKRARDRSDDRDLSGGRGISTTDTGSLQWRICLTCRVLRRLRRPQSALVGDILCTSAPILHQRHRSGVHLLAPARRPASPRDA